LPGGTPSATVPRLGSSLLPPGTSWYAAKALHVSAYALLAGLACWLPSGWGLRAAAWVAQAGHGALTEFLQRFVHGRTGRLFDVGLDTLGVLLGLSLGLALRRLTARA
jgi:VanZ family protein